jgi:hypothetical protein
MEGYYNADGQNDCSTRICPKIVFVIMVSVHHVRTDITIPVIYAIDYVQASVSRVLQILFVNRVRKVII